MKYGWWTHGLSVVGIVVIGILVGSGMLLQQVECVSSFSHSRVERVSLASFHLEGDAQLWYQILKQETPVITGKNLKMGFTQGMVQLNFLTSLESLRGYSSMAWFKNIKLKFEKLLAKLGRLSQERQISFTGGLAESIRTEVQVSRLATLSSAIRLARLFEAKHMALKRSATSSK
ncbi:hypothetical protein Pint_35768 [Pistacia integerrima]|uniref:Uncharacterized protein n=1 Tax=Pistacia integerrima TaxID=434235 RepID=A0ACC0Y201_9ROSI|nr:hypothetical protein Pint_35768 [Pistacia integerrima]